MKDLGKEDLLLRRKIFHNKARFSLSQEQYIQKIPEPFNVINLALAKTPLKPGLALKKASKDEVRAFSKLVMNLRSIIGALNYISTNTREDITFSINHLSQFTENPNLNHLVGSLKVLCYLYNTRKTTLNYYSKGKSDIMTYACKV
ncbi:hypothetical protein O181_110700 [Austropuccinia psidii MF-1]|uniref:Uncharacterized protein n=1 Tax=Austropuccinia psidii MF-1 TaxID=1389203 RepID=A0A9Q3K0Y3_9BASI|nr:hypothetical protein [Austropuccinia psidii MF-1]